MPAKGVGLNTTLVPLGKVEDFTKAYVTTEVPQSCPMHVAKQVPAHSVSPVYHRVALLNLVFGSSSVSTGLYPTATGPLLLSASSFLTGVSPVAGEVEFPFSLLRILRSSTKPSHRHPLIAVCASKNFAVRRSSKLPCHSPIVPSWQRRGSSKLPCQLQLIRAELSSDLSQSSFECLRQVSIPVSWVEHHYS